jgi:leader peptidase (prepilin peptidase)/N-methyltransferase
MEGVMDMMKEIVMEESMALVLGGLEAFLGGRYYQKRFGETLKGMKLTILFTALLCMAADLLFLLYGDEPIDRVKLVLLVGMLVMLARIDAEKMVIPNALLLALTGARTLLLFGECIQDMDYAVYRLMAAGLGILFGSVIFLIVRNFAKGCIGMGDIKLFAVIGYFLGSGAILQTMLASSGLALVFGIWQVARKKITMKDSISFGPYIAAGTILVVMMGA